MTSDPISAAGRTYWNGCPSTAGNTVRNASWRSTTSCKAASNASTSNTPRQPQRHRHVVGGTRALQQTQEPQPLLRKRQRHHLRPLHSRHRKPRRIRPGHLPRQPSHRRVLEQRPDPHLHTQLHPDPAHQTSRQQRMPTQIEEVVIHPDRGHTENLGKHLTQNLFTGIRRRSPATTRADRILRCRQRTAIQLPVHRHRQRIQHHHRSRNHIVRQHPSHMSTQLASQTLYQFTASNGVGVGSRDHIADQPLIARLVLTHHHRGLRDQPDARPVPPRSRPARCGSPGSSPDHRPDPGTPTGPRRFHRTTSPVRYIRSPAGPNGQATNRSAVKPARPR